MSDMTYDKAVANLKFAALLVLNDPNAYLDLLQDAVNDYDEAFEALHNHLHTVDEKETK